ncbi:MAG: TIGR03032 family protein [Flavobacteriales bacterium]
MNNPQPPHHPAPFSCSYTSQVPELLYNLKCTIAISTYQAGKVVLISAKNKEQLVQLPRTFNKPMGIAEDEANDKLALACKDEIVVFKNSKELAIHHPKFPHRYDALYMPRITFNTGNVDIHDLNFGENGELYAVNTLFSCIVSIDAEYNFTPYWKPNFINKYVSEDRCHLNGMAMKNGKPKYASAFNEGNTARSWKENITKTGVIFDVETGEVVCRNLGMPHSPRIFNGELYVLLSATGELVRVNPKLGSYEAVVKLDGFVRGMSLHGEYLFIGLSKLRKNSSTFAKLEFAHEANESGVEIIHLPTGAKTGKITYQTSVDEIYDVHVLKGKTRPNILNPLSAESKMGLVIPGASYWSKPKPDVE